jgi:hypothetical protein
LFQTLILFLPSEREGPAAGRRATSDRIVLESGIWKGWGGFDGIILKDIYSW